MNLKLKLTLFYFIGFFLTFLIIIFILISPGIISKLTKSYSYCNSYGDRDNQLGWVLKQSHESCLSLKNHLRQKVFFDTQIFLNQFGFRDNSLLNKSKPDIVFIGDSWTFGYGVDYQNTFASLVGSKTNMNILNMGVPNYSSLQSIFLYKRFEDKFSPKYIIFLNPNTLTRALCSEEYYQYTLEPCYTLKNNEVKIHFPNKTHMDFALDKKIYPSGFHTSGYNFFDFYFKYKPLEILRNFLNRYGLSSEDYNAEVKSQDFTNSEIELIAKKELSVLADLSNKETKVINIMMHSNLYEKDQITEMELNKNFSNFDINWYKENVINKFLKIKNNGKIELDGHYNNIKKLFKVDTKSLPKSIPIFPLDNVLLLPFGKLPLNIFEERYINMTLDSLKAHRMIGIIQPKNNNNELFQMGCIGKITSYIETPDYRLVLNLEGVCRFVLGERNLNTKGYYEASTKVR